MASVPSFRFDDQTIYLDDESDPYEAAKKGDAASLFTFGPYGGVRVLVYASSGYKGLDDRLEVAAATLRDAGMDGLFVSDEEMRELLAEAEAEGHEGDDAYQQAEADLTYTEAGYLTSYEWAVNDLYPGHEVYGAGVAKYVEKNPDLFDDETGEEIEAVLEKAGASDPRIERAYQAVFSDAENFRREYGRYPSGD
ncbi:hypothetical protein K0U83_16030 [bacterium]|nr:hypothetical protein [bacterium]